MPNLYTSEMPGTFTSLAESSPPVQDSAQVMVRAFASRRSATDFSRVTASSVVYTWLPNLAFNSFTTGLISFAALFLSSPLAVTRICTSPVLA